MLDNLFLSAVAIPLMVGAVLSFLIESLLRPKILPFWRRHLATIPIHIGLCLLLFAIIFALLQRPWFSIIIVLAFLLLVVQVSNAKFHSLREPFIFQDFEYFTDAIKHPRLYIPFLGVGRAIVIAIGFGAALFSGLTLESSLTILLPIADFFMWISALIGLGLTLLWLGARKKLSVVFDPETDLRQLGLMTSLWCYGEEEQCHSPISSQYESIENPIIPPVSPNLVVVQSESFFDVRRLFSGIRTEILQEFDAIKAEAVCQGQVEVAAWGANTVRTEFAFLSGLKSALLGVHRFNPYRKLAQKGATPTLASFLKSLGYRTVCVHPYQASFYARNKVFPLLGFDEFIDIESFKGIEKTGPYIGDVALAEKVCSLLEDSSGQPIFVFVISMENHGPLHMEKVMLGDEKRLYSSSLPKGCDDLTIYLRHLSNADRMAGILRDKMKELSGDSWLCWYGDHVPIMPKVYSAMSTPAGETDYFIWESGESGERPSKAAAQKVKIENLAYSLLQKMGLVNN